MHDGFEKELAAVGQLCGLAIARQDHTVFVSAIPAGPPRDRYARDMREARHNDRGAIVPDLTVTNFPSPDGSRPRKRLYEVKTFGHNPDWHGVPAAMDPVSRRDAAIPQDYEDLARAADRKYCATAAGVDGPILLHLRSLAPVHGLVVGANGEWSRGVDTFIADIARVSCTIPERFGCCHGAEQARGVIAAMARDRLGRVALRGAARVRVAALQAITGQPGMETGAPGSHAQDYRDEWDRVRDNVHVPAPCAG
jgi:hypothetical protein